MKALLFSLFFPLLLVLLAVLAGNVVQSATAEVGDDEDNELVLVQALWRHGDRSPTGTFKTDIYQEDAWPQGWGQLTPKGMEQHVNLGTKLRARYVDQLKFIGGHYKNHEIYVRSTDFNRTLISAISNMIGFFGPGSDTEYPAHLGQAWPGKYVPIAVHTVPGEQDYIVPGGPHCPRQKEVKKAIRKTPEYKQTMDKYRDWFAFLSEKTGEYMDPFSLWMVADAFFIEQIYKPKLVDWANDTVQQVVNEMQNLELKWTHGLELTDMENIHFREELSRLRGGPMLWKMIDNMHNKVSCEKRMNAVRSVDREIKGKHSPLGEPVCTWINPMRYFVYSAHDSTLAALFSAFNFSKVNYDQDGFPHYSAGVTVELWRNKKSGEHVVKVLYWRPEENSFKDITNDISGCQGQQQGCTLEQFTERSLPYQLLPTPEEYCQKPLNPEAPGNSAASTFSRKTFSLILLLLVIMVLAVTKIFA